MNKIICLESTYDKYMEVFDRMKERAGDYVPSNSDMSVIKENLPKYVPFLLWIDDTGYETEENKAMRKEISKILREHFVVASSTKEEETNTTEATEATEAAENVTRTEKMSECSQSVSQAEENME